MMSRRLYSQSYAILRNGQFRTLRHWNTNLQRGIREYQSLRIHIYQTGATFIQPHHPVATTILNEPTIVIERQLEVMNVFLGFEQTNKYAIMDVMGSRIGNMQERNFSLSNVISRQIYKLHRPFIVDVFDNGGNVILTIKRSFSWIESQVKAFLPPVTNVEQEYLNGPRPLDHEIQSQTPQNISEPKEDGILVGESIQN